MTKTRKIGSLLAFSLLVACGNPNGAPPTAPGNDVQPPTTNTGDGEVMGADRVAPGQKLQQGPKLDSQQGLKPAERPASE